MTELTWSTCEDPKAMFEFLGLRTRVGDQKLRVLACACCRFAATNVTWGWTPEAERILGDLERGRDSALVPQFLQRARAEADALQQQAFAHHDSMTRHVPDPSDYVHAAEALFHATDADAFTAATRAADSAIASFVGCPLCCQFNPTDRERQAQAKRIVAGIIREHVQPFGTSSSARSGDGVGARS